MRLNRHGLAAVVLGCITGLQFFNATLLLRTSSSARDLQQEYSNELSSWSQNLAMGRYAKVPLSTNDRDGSVWPSVVYFDELPAPNDAIWPRMHKSSDKNTMTTCIPATTKDVSDERRLLKLFESIQAQTLQSDEVVLVVSDVAQLTTIVSPSNYTSTTASDNGIRWCHAQHSRFSSFHSNLKIMCIGERITAGPARNTAARVAFSGIVSFVDADDQEESNRNAVTKSMFNCHSSLLFLLHGRYTNTTRIHKYDMLASSLARDDESSCPDEQEGVEVIWGHELKKLADKTHSHWLFHRDVHPGHMVVRRSVFQHVQFSTIFKGQDLAFCRDVIYAFGGDNHASVFLNRPLSTYYQSSKTNRELVPERNSSAKVRAARRRLRRRDRMRQAAKRK